MIEIELIADSPKDLLEQINDEVNGTIETKWNESILSVGNELAKGTIRFMPFDWGVNLMDIDLLIKKNSFSK